MTDMLAQLGANSPSWLLVSILLLAIGTAVAYLFKVFYDSLKSQIERIDTIQTQVRQDSADRERQMRSENELMMKELGRMNDSLNNLTQLYNLFYNDVRLEIKDMRSAINCIDK